MRMLEYHDAHARDRGFRFHSMLGERMRRWALSVREDREQEMLGTNVFVTLLPRPGSSLVENVLLARQQRSHDLFWLRPASWRA